MMARSWLATHRVGCSGLDMQVRGTGQGNELIGQDTDGVTVASRGQL